MWSKQCVSVVSVPQHRQQHLYYSACGWGLGVVVLQQASADVCLVRSLSS